MRGESFDFRRQLCSNSWFYQKIMIQGYGSQLVLNITQEVRLLPTYISKLYDGGRRKNKRYETYDLGGNLQSAKEE